MTALLTKLTALDHIEYLEVDRDLIILQVSCGVKRFADRPQDVEPGKDVRQGFPELIGTEELIISVFGDRQSSFELKSIGRFKENSSPLYIDIYIKNVEDELIIFFEDVTEKMVLEQALVQRIRKEDLLLSALADSHNYLDKLITLMADVLLVTTSTGKIKIINQAALDLLGYKERELIDSPISKIISDNNFLCQLSQNSSYHCQTLQDCEVICRTRTGESLTIAFSCSVIQVEIDGLQDFVYIGRDLTKRKRFDNIQNMEHAVRQILSESAILEEATPKIIQTICYSLGWELGELWRVNQQTNMLNRVCSWHMPSVHFPEFELLTQQMVFAPGIGLPGSIWTSGNPIWADNAASTPNCPRAEIADQEGLHGAFGFPLVSESETLGVMMFFNLEIQPPQEDVLKTIVNIGYQIGQFIKRKQIERALQESEKRFQAFMNNSPAVAFMKDEFGRLVYINKQFERNFNIKYADLQGKTDFDWLPEETAKQTSENDRHVLSTGKTLQIMETVPAPDGCIHYWLSFKFPFKDSEGRRFVGGVAVDISDRYHLEQALFQEKELAQVTLQSIGDAVITTDATSVIKYLNPVAEELTGWSQQEAMGLQLSEIFKIVNETTRELVENPVEQALREGRIVSIASHGVLITRNGKEVAINDKAAPIRANNSQIIGAVLVFQDVTQTRKIERQLSWQASHDALTGLLNRREFENRLEEVLRTAKAQNKPHALCYLDLDRFKIVNDTCGHLAGDELLRQVTTLFQAEVRSSDIVARLGGDEFGILLKYCPLEPAQRIANKVLKSIGEFRFVWQEKTFNIGVSIGLIVVNADSQTVNSLLSAADAACYVAKNRGRNCVQVIIPKDIISDKASAG